MERFVMPVKPSPSWPVQCSGSDASWDQKKAVLCPRLLAEVGAKAQCPGFQPLGAPGFIIIWKSLCEESSRKGWRLG